MVVEVVVCCFLVLAKGRVTIGTVDCQIKLSIGAIRVSIGDALLVLCSNFKSVLYHPST